MTNKFDEAVAPLLAKIMVRVEQIELPAGVRMVLESSDDSSMSYRTARWSISNERGFDFQMTVRIHAKGANSNFYSSRSSSQINCSVEAGWKPSAPPSARGTRWSPRFFKTVDDLDKIADTMVRIFQERLNQKREENAVQFLRDQNQKSANQQHADLLQIVEALEDPLVTLQIHGNTVSGHPMFELAIQTNDAATVAALLKILADRRYPLDNPELI